MKHCIIETGGRSQEKGRQGDQKTRDRSKSRDLLFVANVLISEDKGDGGGETEGDALESQV